MRFELWRRFRSHSDSKNLDSESDDSDSDSKKSESEFLEFNQLQNYKNSDGVGLESVQNHLHSKNSDSGSQILHSESVGHHWEFARSLPGVYLEFLDSKTSGLELNLVVTFASLISIT